MLALSAFHHPSSEGRPGTALALPLLKERKTTMCNELNQELDRGKLLAMLLAEHLDDMSAENCEIPVKARDKDFVCRVEIKRPDVVFIPDIDGGYLVGKVSFQTAVGAEEYAKAINKHLMIQTPIPFHVDDCPGCVSLYFSRSKQEVIASCNECGQRRELMLNGLTILCQD